MEENKKIDKKEESSSNTNNPQQIIVTHQMTPQKSVGVAVLLSIFFGPLGMFYSTITGGIIMLIVTALVGIFTLGFGLFLTWPICVIWAAVAANITNKN